MLRYSIFIYFFAVLLFSSYLLASTHQKNMLDIHHICNHSPAKCLPEINRLLVTTPSKSRVWYDLMQYKFEVLFLLQDIAALNKLTNTFINNEKLPIPFEVSVAIYYAKSLIADTTLSEQQKRTQSKRYIKKAKKLLLLMNKAYPDPYLLIQLANIQMYVNEYQQAYNLLISLTEKYKNHPDIDFIKNLYGNLGHLSDRLGYKKKAITYWQKSLQQAIILKNNQQTATIYFNLANSQKTNNQLSLAKQSYSKAIYYATLANDNIKRAQAQLSLARLLIQLADTTQAKQVINNINDTLLPSNLLAELIALKNKFS